MEYETPKCAIDAKEYARRRRRFLMARYGRSRARVVAEHYLSLVNIAMELKKINEFRQRHPESQTLKECEDYLMRQIADKHDEDFGIELKWKDETANP